jgi:hypothetical protein
MLKFLHVKRHQLATFWHQVGFKPLRSGKRKSLARSCQARLEKS